MRDILFRTSYDAGHSLSYVRCGIFCTLSKLKMDGLQAFRAEEYVAHFLLSPTLLIVVMLRLYAPPTLRVAPSEAPLWS